MTIVDIKTGNWNASKTTIRRNQVVNNVKELSIAHKHLMVGWSIRGKGASMVVKNTKKKILVQINLEGV